MARFFDRISETTMRWLDALSDRERRLLSILALGLCVFLVLGALFLAMGKISSLRSEAVRNKELLDQIHSLESQFLKTKEANEKATRTIMKNDVSLFTLIQSISSRLGLDIKALNETSRPLPKSSIVEVSVKVNLSKLSIDRLTALIEAIETSDHGEVVKVTKLKINKRYDEPDLLDLQMTVSTWKSA